MTRARCIRPSDRRGLAVAVAGIDTRKELEMDCSEPYSDDDEMMTVCDRCGEEIPLAEVNSVDEEGHEWQWASLCNDCYAEVV